MISDAGFPYYVWLIAGLALCALETVVPGAFLIWIGLAGLCVGVIEYLLPGGFGAQALEFAALTLGLPLRRVWLGIVLPQAVRAVLPVLANMVIAMFKETALLSSITIMELLAVGKSIGSINFRYIEPLTIAGVLYFLVSYACARFVRTLESPHVHAR